jgi:serralysin
MSKTLYACLTQDPVHHKIVEKHENVDSDINVVRAAFLKTSIWPNNSTINIVFAKNEIKLPDGTNAKHDPEYTKEKAEWTQKIIEKYYVPLINLNITWDAVPIDKSDVRISFVAAKGAFSLLGTQSLTIPKDTATMNLGWLDQNSSNTDKNPELTGTGIVVVHEFGHMLGMIHEHQRGDEPMKWNKDKVYEALGDPPNNWSHDMVDSQIFKQWDMNTLNSSKFDKFSAMEYIFPNTFFISPPNLKDTKYLSNLDIIWVNKTYPGKSLPPGIKSDGGGTNPYGGSTGTGIDGSGTWFSKNWYWLLISLIVFGIIIAITLTFK